MMHPGFIIDVLVTLSVSVRGEGLTKERAFEVARDFASDIAPTDHFVAGYSSTLADDCIITEVSLESSNEESCEVLEELQGEPVIGEAPKAITDPLTRCQNCTTLYPESKLDRIDDVFDRVAPGETMPPGQCPDPECGALCQYVEETEG